MIVCRGGEGRIEIDNLPMSVTVKQAGETPRPPASSLKTLIENAEREAILQALDATGNNRNTAAALLKIHRTGLYQKMKKYHIP
jgi:transcriptional regulator with PAS, ATPase and Fis domain